ncbi:MAG: DNA helicase II [Gammaproteobacteria bacterium]|nr:DNA helicase II [Candidatus Neomarinimicrobiota bacterium]MBT7308858.1 DNA helicase II [Gammaproteobacteria bacterium]
MFYSIICSPPENLNTATKIPMEEITDIIGPLNEAQRQAVTTESRNTLVLAGAGSGKTRVLVHRIAWLIRAEKISPWSILAVTFTNKAAREMKGRVEQLLDMPSGTLWIGTFHGLAHRLLRNHWQEANLPQNFQILDSEDQLRLVRRLLKEMNLDEERWPPRQATWFINEQKDKGFRPQQIDTAGDFWLSQMVQLYTAYEAACQRGGMVDFAELLLRAHEMWLNNPELLNHYRNRFSHLLVDEFQDTNTIQYAWLRLLTGDNGSIFVVGDDDQSVYGWRGAQVENIRSFTREFPLVETLRLEQNYRSSGNILNAANALIDNNPGRLGKELWTEDNDGVPIQLYSAYNDLDEARFIAEQIQFWVDKGGRRDESAILYRSNAQSRVLEEALLSASIPYRIYGGLRFFERAEIKDALSYLRLMAHRHDDAAFERVVNTPTRGIGERTVMLVREYAQGAGISLWRAALAQTEGDQLAARARNALRNFLQLIEQMSHDGKDKALNEQVEIVLKNSSLIDHHKKNRSEKGLTRIENLEELVTAAGQFSPEDESLNLLDEFLAQAALESGDTQGDEWEDCVQLMTLHSAKGLEFHQVFLSGLEEGLFPHSRSSEDSEQLEEERRLCYVGITRARQKLTLSHAESRRLYGKESYPRVSRFIKEIPVELLQEVRIRSTISRPVNQRSSSYTQNHRSSILEDSGTGLQPGQQVRHAKFGEGTVLMLEGSGPQARIQIHFPEAGTKWLVAGYAKLEPT